MLTKDLGAQQTPEEHVIRYAPGSQQIGREREISRCRLHLVKHRSTLKNRVHSTLITFGHQRHMSDLFGVAGRRLLKELEMPEPARCFGPCHQGQGSVV